MSASTYELIRDGDDCDPRGTIAVKGRGEMETYILNGRLAWTYRRFDPPVND